VPVPHSHPCTPMRAPAYSRARRHLSSAVLALLLGLLGALVAPATAFADPGDPNPHMIDWTVVDSFRGTAGNDIPLREGQTDCKSPECNPPVDGFGRRHILEHGVVPDHEDIQETVGTEGFCVPAPDNRVICTNTDLSLVVVHVTHNDPRSGDGRPFGIITAYYFLPCFQAADCTGPEQPHKVDTALTYTGAGLSAKLTNNFGTPIDGRAVRFALGTGDAQQTCTGTTTASGTATCTIGSVDQPQGTSNAVHLAVTFGGDDDYNPSSTSAELGLTSRPNSTTPARRTSPTTLPRNWPPSSPISTETRCLGGPCASPSAPVTTNRRAPVRRAPRVPRAAPSRRWTSP
jgi:hypothetical protein